MSVLRLNVVVIVERTRALQAVGVKTEIRAMETEDSRTMVEHFSMKGWTPKMIVAQLVSVHGETEPVKTWAANFKAVVESSTRRSDGSRPGRPISAVTEEWYAALLKRLNESIKENRLCLEKKSVLFHQDNAAHASQECRCHG